MIALKLFRLLKSLVGTYEARHGIYDTAPAYLNAKAFLKTLRDTETFEPSYASKLAQYTKVKELI